MGRDRVTIPFNVEAFKKYIKESGTFSERAQSFGVSKQAMNSWFQLERIPPRALAEIALDLKLSPEAMAEILLVKTNVAYKKRTKRLKYSIEIYEHDEEE